MGLQTHSSMDAWNPFKRDPEGHFTALEAWVHRLVSEARMVSPLFWSHRIKHVASDSRICVELYGQSDELPEDRPDAYYLALAGSVQPGPSRGIYESWVGDNLWFPVPEGLQNTVFEQGTVFSNTNSSTWALGQITRTCFCGWKSTTDPDSGRTWCMFPKSVCAQLKMVEEISASVTRICDRQRGMYWNHWDNSEDVRVIGAEAQFLVHQSDPMDCPWNLPDAAAWGLLDEQNFVDNWLFENETFNSETASRFTTKHLLYEGRGGIRYMNAEKVLKRGRDSPFFFLSLWT